MKMTFRCFILGMLCLFLSTHAGAQSPLAPSQVRVCVSPDTGVINQDTLTVPLTYPLLNQQGHPLTFNFDLDIHVRVELVSTNNISKVHLEISEDIGGMPMVHLNTSFDVAGAGNMYATQLQSGNSIDLALAQNQLGEVDYKVWLEDDQGNLSSVVSASTLHYID